MPSSNSRLASSQRCQTCSSIGHKCIRDPAVSAEKCVRCVKRGVECNPAQLKIRQPKRSACDCCRRRKVKCNGQTSNCSKRNDDGMYTVEAIGRPVDPRACIAHSVIQGRFPLSHTLRPNKPVPVTCNVSIKENLIGSDHVNASLTETRLAKPDQVERVERHQTPPGPGSELT